MATARANRAPRRMRDWFDTFAPITVAAAGVQGIDLLAAGRGGIAEAQPLGTILAVRFSFTGVMGTATNGAGLRIGLKVQGKGVGQPRPSTNPHTDWMFHHIYWTRGGTTSTALVSITENDIYSKARRKITDSGDTLFMILEDGGVASSSWTGGLHVRTLFAYA